MAPRFAAARNALTRSGRPLTTLAPGVEVFLLRFVEMLECQGGRLNIENQLGHETKTENYQDGKPVEGTKLAILVMVV